MIYGVGIDIVKVERMREVVERWGERFLNKVFTEGEIAYCYGKKNPFPSLAVRFAAKEAFIKAIGSVKPFALADIEIVSRESGRPEINPQGRLRELLKGDVFTKAHLSLSHEREYGIACVVIEKEGK